MRDYSESLRYLVLNFRINLQVSEIPFIIIIYRLFENCLPPINTLGVVSDIPCLDLLVEVLLI